MEFDAEPKNKTNFQERVTMSKKSCRQSSDSQLSHVIYTVLAKPPEERCAMTFHLTDCKRMPASVRRIVEAGNRVMFGSTDSENYIENVVSDKRIPMKREGGAYTIRVKIPLKVHGVEKFINSRIVIDGGAADYVMPKS